MITALHCLTDTKPIWKTDQQEAWTCYVQLLNLAFGSDASEHVAGTFVHHDLLPDHESNTT